jgi:Cu2+-containing amine oxidase
MSIHRRCSSIFLLALAAALSVPVIARAQHPAADLPQPTQPLSEEERSKAISLASREQRPALSAFELREAERPHTVVSAVEPVTEKGREGRLAMVTLYQYNGDVTIRRIVNLDSGAVVSEARAERQTPPLAPVEVELARGIALADPRIADAVAPFSDRLKVEALVASTSDRNDPLFGHRVAYLLFRTPQGYLANIGEVFVDLTAARLEVHR